jgi:hypothetical protein
LPVHGLRELGDRFVQSSHFVLHRGDALGNGVELGPARAADLLGGAGFDQFGQS